MGKEVNNKIKHEEESKFIQDNKKSRVELVENSGDNGNKSIEELSQSNVASRNTLLKVSSAIKTTSKNKLKKSIKKEVNEDESE